MVLVFVVLFVMYGFLGSFLDVGWAVLVLRSVRQIVLYPVLTSAGSCRYLRPIRAKRKAPR